MTNQKTTKPSKKNTLTIVLFTIIFIVYLISFISSQYFKPNPELYDIEEILTWPEDSAKLSQSNTDDKNKVWESESATSFAKNHVVKATAENMRSDKIKTVEQVNMVKQLFGLDKLEVPQQIEIIGFDSKNLKWQGESGLIIGNGKSYVDLENIPMHVKKIEYKDGIFIYTLKNGGEIALSQGTLNSEGKIEGVEFKDISPKDISFEIPGKGDRIIFQDKDEIENGFIIEGNAEVKIGDRVFKAKDGKQGFVALKEGSHFIAEGVRLITPRVEIDIPEKAINGYTDIVLKYVKEGFDSKQYIQIFESGLTKEGIEYLSINMKGKNIDVDFSKREGKEQPAKKNIINADGENLKIKFFNGLDVKIDGDKTFVSRYNHGYDLTLDEEYIITNAQAERDKTTKVGGEVVVKPGEGASVSVKEDKKVCIGEFCEVRGALGKKLKNPIRIYDYEASTTEKLISKSKVYAYESEISKILESAPKGLTEAQFGQYLATQNLANVEFISVVETDWVDKKAINENIDEMLEPLGLPQSELDRIESFKLEQIFPNLKGNWRGTPTYVPPKSVVTIMFTDRGEVYGSFTINMNGQDYAIKIPGRYLQKAIAQKLKEYGSVKDSASLDLLYQRYQKK